MLVYAGIDEAGYGPMLGPLCVACTLFVLPEYDPGEGPPDLWKLLGGAVCRRPGDKRRRVAVDDSKKLKGAADGVSHPLRHLERGVLSFCPAGEHLPATDTELLSLVNAEVPPHPWFASPTNLPVGFTADQLGIARARLQRSLDGAAVRCEAVWCEAIDAADLNRQLTETGSKATVNFAAAMRMVEAVWHRWPDAHPRIVIDRHGARVSYARLLEQCLPGAEAEVVAETPTLSRYVVRRGDSQLTVSFAVDGDERFFPIALASMTAKYVRELLMLRLNRFFRRALPQLRPTAGYHGDARRYVTEIKPVMEKLGLSSAELVRSA
ncbi:MAG: ribonuclease H family protein [Planctomycetota bacterium]